MVQTLCRGRNKHLCGFYCLHWIETYSFSSSLFPFLNWNKLYWLQLKLHTDFSPYIDETASEDHGDEWTQDIYNLFLWGNSLLKPLYPLSQPLFYYKVSTVWPPWAACDDLYLWQWLCLFSLYIVCILYPQFYISHSGPCALFVGPLQFWFTLWCCGFVPIIDVIFFFCWDDLVWSVKCLSWRTEGSLDLCFLSLFDPWHWRGL